jgi:hypothetical protein
MPVDAGRADVRARIEIVVHHAGAEEIALAIVTGGRAGASGDGVVTVSPVDVVYRIRTGEQVGSLELPGCECIGDGCPLAAKLLHSRGSPTREAT